jgi:hypothetical protein
MRTYGYAYEEPGEYPATEAHIVVLGEILEQMANGRRKDFYSAYWPHLHLESNPPNRALVSQVLGYIWRRCQAEMLPELNFLVVEKPRKGQNISECVPGKFVQGAWRERYHTMRGFKGYAKRRSEEAAFLLDSWILRISVEGIIRRTVIE